jgi:hypothetical protein
MKKYGFVNLDIEELGEKRYLKIGKLLIRI